MILLKFIILCVLNSNYYFIFCCLIHLVFLFISFLVLIMKPFYILFIIVFFSFNSFCQSFSMMELIKMSKMDNDTFDTYVTSRGFKFFNDTNEDQLVGVTYALNRDRIEESKASKFITLYQLYYDRKYSITYQTMNMKDYLQIKKEIKVLGFGLVDSEIFKDNNGASSNHFQYRKGKSRIDLYATPTSYEINFEVSN